MTSPDIPDLPFTMDGGIKVFHLIPEPVKRRIVPWKTLDVWGYNGSCPGPTIQVQQGDRCESWSRTGFRKAPPCIGTAWKFRWSRTVCHTSARSRLRRAKHTPTNSRCIRKEHFSTTRIAPCRK